MENMDNSIDVNKTILKKWTQEEITYLINNSDKNPKELSSVLNRSVTSIYCKKNRLGIKPIKRKWTKEEIDILRTYWGTTNLEHICRKLNRSPRSIKGQVYKMKLGPIHSTGNYFTTREISEMLGVYQSTVIQWIKNKKLKGHKKTFIERKFNVIILEDFLDFLEKNQNMWNSKNLPYGLYGDEPEWLKIKRRADLFPSTTPSYKKWTKEEVSKLESLSRQGLTNKEISIALNRSVDSIASKKKALIRARKLRRETKYGKQKHYKY